MNETVARMNIFLKDESEIDYYHALINKKCQNVNCFVMKSSSSNKWLVVNPKGIDKSVTLESLGREINISLEEMIFFGDGLNDLEVMESVGYSVAMANALDEIKANAIPLSNNEDGIGVWLEKYLRKESL